MLSRIFTTAESVVMRRCAKMLTTQPIAHYQTQSSANATTHIKAPWYTIKQEERIPQPSASTGDEDAFVFEPKPQFKKLFNVLSQLRCHYPREVWHSITRMYPHRSTPTKPICVDIAVGAEGRGGVELARRGFRVYGVEADPQLLAQTFQYAQAHNAPIELMTAKVENSLLGDASADVITFFHGLHLVDTHAALKEAWRLLKPHGRLVAAWNDRDLSSPFIRELEDVMERHVSTYNRFQKQRGVEEWGERLEEGGLFRLREFSVFPNPIQMPSASALLDCLDSMSFVRSHLRGEARKRFNADVRGILERRFGRKAFVLPLETKLFVLEKIHSQDDKKKRFQNGKQMEKAELLSSSSSVGDGSPHKTIFS